MREDCTTCAHGKAMVGVILCEIENRVKTNTTMKCENYKRKTEQTTLEGME